MKILQTNKSKVLFLENENEVKILKELLKKNKKGGLIFVESSENTPSDKEIDKVIKLTYKNDR
jgi:hypothetical protein